MEIVMLFWILLALLLVFIFLLQQVVQDKYKSIITKITLGILWFVSSFRYMIGADYEQYMLWYDLALDNPIMEVFLEPSFLLVLKILHYFDCTYQAMFLVYATITLLMVYKGLCYYLSSQRQLLVAMLMFSFFYDGFFYTMNNIRAAAALSILFYGTRYICERNLKKFSIVFLVAFLFHYSAILFVPIYFIRFIREQRLKPLVQILLIILSFVAGYTLFISKLFFFAISNMGTYAAKYGSLIVGEKGVWSISSTIIFCTCCFFIYLYTSRNDSFDKCDSFDNRIFINNMSLLYVLFLIMFNLDFSSAAFNLTDICHRMPLFFVPFFFMSLSYSICALWNRKREMTSFLLIFICMLQFIRVIYYMPMSDAAKTSPRISIGNINYEFNFRLIN